MLKTTLIKDLLKLLKRQEGGINALRSVDVSDCSPLDQAMFEKALPPSKILHGWPGKIQSIFSLNRHLCRYCPRNDEYSGWWRH